MPARRAITPTLLGRRRTRVLIPTSKFWLTRHRWIPNRLPKDAAQPRDGGAIGQNHYPAMEVARSQVAVEDVAEVGIGIAVMVPVNEPDQIQDRLQLFV